MPEPDAFEVALGGETGTKLRFVQREFDEERVAVTCDIVDKDALTGVAEVEHLFSRAVLYIEVEGDVVAILADKEGAPLAVSEGRSMCI
jgi:hypothetical protein